MNEMKDKKWKENIATEETRTRTPLTYIRNLFTI